MTYVLQTLNSETDLFAASRSPLADTLACCWMLACCEIDWTLEPLGGSPSGNAGMWGRGLLCKSASVKDRKQSFM